MKIIFNYFKNFALTLAVISFIIATAYAGEPADKDMPSFVKQVDSGKLKKTRITPALDEKITTGENLIFCSTFQMVWNEMCNKYAQGTLEIENAPAYAAKLNALYKQPPLLDEASYIAMSGLGKENIVKKINETVLRRFGHLKEDERPPQFSFTTLPNDIVAFAYLFKDLRFPEAFAKMEPIVIKSGDKFIGIDAFGINGEFGKEKLYAQIHIKYFNDETDEVEKPKGIIMSLKTDSETDELIISTVKPDGTLRQSYDNIINLSKKYSDRAFIPNQNNSVHITSISIPKLDFNIIHSYKELVGNRVLNKALRKYNDVTYIEMVMQVIALTLNEKGAKVMSYSTMLFCGSAYVPKPVQITPPFIILLKNKYYDSPYFMTYVDNEEVMSHKRFDELQADPHYNEISSNPLLVEIITLSTKAYEEKFLKELNERNDIFFADALILAIKYGDTVRNFISCYKNEPETESDNKNHVIESRYREIINKLRPSNNYNGALDPSGNTALMYAIEYENPMAVKILLDHDADPKLSRKDGNNAFNIASRKKNQQFIQLLTERQKK